VRRVDRSSGLDSTASDEDDDADVDELDDSAVFSALSPITHSVQELKRDVQRLKTSVS